MKRYAWLCIIFACILFVLQTEAGTALAAGTASVSGTVVTATTDSPVEGVNVVLTGPGGPFATAFGQKWRV